jgi:hypothetical protein
MKKRETKISATKCDNENVDWDRLQSWLQEATLVLDYCTRLAIVKRTGDVVGTLGDNFNYMMEYESEDKEISEAKIRGYVANIGRLAESGWKTNEGFPFFAPID